MILSDIDTRRLLDAGTIKVAPLGDNAIQPASIDLRLDNNFLVFSKGDNLCIDPTANVEAMMKGVHVLPNDVFILHPGDFILASTVERITLARTIMARLEGKSSLGRLGLLVHSTAGLIDPGWDGHITLELANVAPLPIVLRPGMKIAQITFELMSTPVINPYGSEAIGSRYQGQVLPTASRIHWDLEKRQ